MLRRLPLLGVLAVGVALLPGCAPDLADPPPEDPDGPLDGRVMVFAAASLTEVMADVEVEFTDLHPDLDLIVNLAGSSSLREQILAGAPADLFVSANESTMQTVVDAGLTRGEVPVLARNGLMIAVPAGNPAGVTGLEDLARSELLIGLCAPGVPCGEFARAALASAGVTPRPDTEEPDVRALTTKLLAGELDVGIVYRSDVTATHPALEGLEIPTDHDVEVRYRLAVLADAPQPRAAAAVAEFLLGPRGRAILERRGFETEPRR